MNGKRAKSLRKEYRRIADDVIQGDVKAIIDTLTKKIARYRTLIIALSSMLAMVLTAVVMYAISI